MTRIELEDLARRLVRTGWLPNQSVAVYQTAKGQYGQCGLCIETVTPTDDVCSIEHTDERLMHFHQQCFFAWQGVLHPGSAV